MKLGPYLLINVLLIGGAIYLYDTTRPAPRRQQAEQPAYDPLQADDLAISDPEYTTEAPLLDGGGNETRVQNLNARIESMEADIARLRRALAARSSAGDGGTPNGSSGDNTLPVIDLDEVGDVENPVFDERTLTSLEAYVDEINRRKAEERQRARISGQLDRLGIQVTEEQEKAVVEATLAYQKQAAEVYRGTWPRDEAGRAQRKEAFTLLQEQYASKINSLVPAAEAEKIINSRVSRSRGFVSAGMPNRGGGRSGAKRGGKDR